MRNDKNAGNNCSPKVFPDCGTHKNLLEVKMKGLKVLSLAVVIALLVSTGSLYAEETGTSGYASVDVLSNYVWRGQKLSNSWVVQPSVGITYGGFGANIWANYDSDSKIDEGDGHGEFTETDITLNYSRSIDKFALSAGYIYYALDGASDTQELYVSAGYDTLLKPTLTVYYDFDEGEGAFIVASIGHTVEIAKGYNLNLGASASYDVNNSVMGFDRDGEDFSNFYNGELTSSLNIPVWKAITVTPKIAYSFPLSSDAKNAIKGLSDDGDKDIVYGGINLTLGF
jgi:hypothetical protein